MDDGIESADAGAGTIDIRPAYNGILKGKQEEMDIGAQKIVEDRGLENHGKNGRNASLASSSTEKKRKSRSRFRLGAIVLALFVGSSVLIF